MTVELLAEPASVSAIAEDASVAWGTAESEIERLVDDGRVRQVTVDGDTKYEPNPVQEFLAQVLELIRENERDGLEERLVEYQERIEALQTEYGVDAGSRLREGITEDDLRSAEMREIRNVADTWEALETERRLVKQALNLYDDVRRFDQGEGDSEPVSA